MSAVLDRPGQVRLVRGRSIHIDPTPIRVQADNFTVAGYDVTTGDEMVSVVVYGNEKCDAAITAGDLDVIARVLGEDVDELGWNDDDEHDFGHDDETGPAVAVAA